MLLILNTSRRTLNCRLAADPHLTREAHVKLPQRRADHLTARATQRAEVGLPDRGNRLGIDECRRIVELVHVVAARVWIADDQRVTAGAGSARHRAVDRLRLTAVKRQHPVRPPPAENRSLAGQVVVAAEDQRMFRMETRETDVVRPRHLGALPPSPRRASRDRPRVGWRSPTPSPGSTRWSGTASHVRSRRS